MSPINSTTPDSGISTVMGNKDELIRSTATILGVVAAVIVVVVGLVWISCCILVPREKRQAEERLARQRRETRRRLERDLGIFQMDVLGEGAAVPRPVAEQPNTDDRVRRVEEEDLEMGLAGLGIRSPRAETETEIETVAGPSRLQPARARFQLE
ncbi:hypothetical protein V8F20_002998 [Naviculisporaceae sp. PSN 640]